MNSLRRAFPFIRPYKWYAFFLVITTVLPVAMELAVPRALRYVIDSGIELGDMSAILQGALFMLAAATVGAIATLGQGVCRAQLSQGVAYDMRNDMFAHLQTFSFANLDRLHTGQLMTRLSSDVDLVRIFVSTGMALLLRALLMVFGSLFMMLLTDWQLALIMLVLLPLSAILIWSVMRLARPMFTVVQQKLSALNTTVQENLAGVQVVKSFVREQHEIDGFEGYNRDYMVENIRVGRLLAIAMPILTILTSMGIVAVIWFGGVSAIDGRLSVGELVAFNSYLLIGMAPLLLLGNLLTMFSRADASAQRVWEVLDMQPAIQEPTTPHRPEQLQGAVRFTQVSFHYDGPGNGLDQNDHADGTASTRGTPRKRDTATDEPDDVYKTSAANPLGGQNGVSRHGGGNVLNEVSFVAQPGQRIALLGATGSGKSTLINMIPRFYDPHAGRIEIDGVDVRNWDLDFLRRSIGVVMQQTILFSGTIRENIAYGRPDADMERVRKAATAAQAHDFIMQMPDGYNSLVEERGANLSGGQKQRIAIARALLVSPGILILDDSASAVDLETEFKLQGALEELMRDRTTFIVAQRINSVLSADQILVLEHGRIVAQGTHRQLLMSSPIYREIHDSQLGDGHAPPAGTAEEQTDRGGVQ